MKRIKKAPQLLRLDGGGLGLLLAPSSLIVSRDEADRLLALADAEDGETPSASAATAGDSAPVSIDVLGYRQTKLPAADGGRANANGFRIRHGAMRRFARTFAGRPFITGHDWGDVRSRGGTVTKAWASPPPDAEDELGTYQRCELTASWAIEAYNQKQIELFSIGARGLGEVRCTVHDCPPWTGDCWCWPGSDCGDGRIAELEYEDALALELSMVNVPAVDGTGYEETAELLAQMLGRPVPQRLAAELRAGGGERGPSAPPRARSTMAVTATPSPEREMDPRERQARKLGLAPEATWEQIEAEQDRRGAAALQLQSENDASFFDQQIASLRTTHEVSDAAVTKLRAAVFPPGAGGAATTLNRAQLASSLDLIRDTAPARVAEPTAAPVHLGARPALLSERPMLAQPAGGDLPETDDRLQQWQGNPELARTMRLAGVRADDIRKHGPRRVATVPEAIINAQGA